MSQLFKSKAFFSLLLCALSATSMAQVVKDSPVRMVRMSGYVGERIDACIEHRVKAQDVEHLVEPFRHQDEKSRWQSEFWGKWIQGAIASYRYNRDPELYQIIKNAAESLMETQLPNGYIGNYAPEYQLQAWDIWGRKYSALGLIAAVPAAIAYQYFSKKSDDLYDVLTERVKELKAGKYDKRK